MPVISDEERKKREEAINYARASVGLEGLVFSESDEADAKRFINGEIDMGGYIALGLKRANAIREKSGTKKP